MLAILAIMVYTKPAVAGSMKDSTKSKTATVTFTVTEMGCGTDRKMVETALYRKKGVKNVSITGDTIIITYLPEKVSYTELITVIENTGTCEDPNAKVHKVKFKTQ